MDPLSISASLVAVLQLTGTVIQYINRVEGTPKDRQRLLLELSTVNGMLLILQDQAEQARAGDPWHGKMITILLSNAIKNDVEALQCIFD